MKVYNVIGLMSGTSLDGVDISYCRFYKNNNDWKYEVVDSITVEYSYFWNKRLRNLKDCSALEISIANIEYGSLIGSYVKEFISKNNYNIDFICSHGHTIFHQPENGLTLQIGCGNKIFQLNSIPVISNFRIMDVAKGGQGAPLVPIGDKLLFSEFDYCINLGGFANISYNDEIGERIAFDICPVNIVLNLFANQLGSKFDNNGEVSKSGEVCEELLEKLNGLEYYKNKPPKSLGNEWLESEFLPVIYNYNIPVNDILRTCVSHIAMKINKCISSGNPKVLLTGGGVYNKFLIEILREMSSCEFVVPDNQLVNYKEAMIFAFLGVLKIENEINCLKSVTGAKSDSTCGILYN